MGLVKLHLNSLNSIVQYLQYCSQRKFCLIAMQEQQKNRSKWYTILKIIVAVASSMILYDFVTQLLLMKCQQEEINVIAASYLTNFNKFQSKMRQTFPKIESIPDEKVRDLYMLKEKIQLMAQIFQKEKRSLEQDHLTAQNLNQIVALQSWIQEQRKIIEVLHSHSRELIRRKRLNYFREMAKENEFSDPSIQNSLKLAQYNLVSSYIDLSERKKWTAQVNNQETHFQEKYRIESYIKQIPLCVVITMKNNAKDQQFQSTIQSVLNQEYLNYKIVIIDDASKDHTVENIRLFLKEKKVPSDKYLIIANDKKKPLALNIYNGITGHCDEEDIVVLMKGGDELLGNHVFSLLNAAYRISNNPIVYTNCLYGNIESNKLFKGNAQRYIQQQKEMNYRTSKHNIYPLRTFKASLFLKIKPDDLKEGEKWPQSEQSFLIPLLQLACGKISFMNEYVYFYNSQTQMDGSIKQPIQEHVSTIIRSKPAYKCLPEFSTSKSL